MRKGKEGKNGENGKEIGKGRIERQRGRVSRRDYSAIRTNIHKKERGS